MSSFHGGPDSVQDGYYLADMCMMIKDKVRLVVVDGLFGNINHNGSGSAPHAFQLLGGDGGNHPSSTLYFSRDMVATDSVIYDDILDEARAEGSPKSTYRYGYLQVAADDDHQLGTFEMREHSGQDSYSVIDLVDV